MKNSSYIFIILIVLLIILIAIPALIHGPLIKSVEVVDVYRSRDFGLKIEADGLMSSDRPALVRVNVEREPTGYKFLSTVLIVESAGAASREENARDRFSVFNIKNNEKKKVLIKIIYNRKNGFFFWTSDTLNLLIPISGQWPDLEKPKR